MKRIIRILIGSAVLLIAFGALSSCDLLMSLLLGEEEPGLTLQERIDAFELDLNSAGRSELATTHFHPDMQNYDQLAATITLSTSPLSFDNEPFTFGTPTINMVAGLEVATCTYTNFVGTLGTIAFTMELYGDDYRIRKLLITLDTDPDNPYELKVISRR